jgi:hypothetical protein
MHYQPISNSSPPRRATRRQLSSHTIHGGPGRLESRRIRMRRPVLHSGRPPG